MRDGEDAVMKVTSGDSGGKEISSRQVGAKFTSTRLDGKENLPMG